jgi:hypothetical protein
MFEELSREEVHQAVDRVIADFFESVGVSGPPVDALDLARRHLGLEVSLQDDSPRSRRRSSIKHAPLLTSPASAGGGRGEEQLQALAAQKIGEHLEPSLRERLGIPPHQRRALMGESLSHLLADHLLVPTRWLAEQARACGHDLLELKATFRTASHERIAWRLLDLEEPCIITIIDNDQISRRRSNFWRVRRQLAPAEQECQTYVNTYSRPRTVRSAGWTVQGWPVHQADWKREVLRSVIDEGFEEPAE